MAGDLGAQLAAVLEPLVLGVVGTAVAYLTPLLRRHANDRAVREARASLASLAEIGVADAYQREVKDKKRAGARGGWNKQAAAAARASVVEGLGDLGAREIAVLRGAGYAEAQVERLLGELVEHAVLRLARGRAGRAQRRGALGGNANANKNAAGVRAKSRAGEAEA